MKTLLLFTVLISNFAFALGENDLTGSFDFSPVPEAAPVDERLFTGATSVDETDQSRSIASIQEQVEDTPEVTEITGSFQ